MCKIGFIEKIKLFEVILEDFPPLLLSSTV